MHRLDGKIALVTGAARGTGAVIARRSWSRGREGRPGRRARRAGPGRSPTSSVTAARFAHLDVTDEAGWSRVVDGHRGGAKVRSTCSSTTPRCCTSPRSTRPRPTRSSGSCASTCSDRSSASARACRCCGRRARAAIVNVGSIDSVQGAALTGAYTASKFALRGLTKVVALENRKRGVRANIVCPMLGNPEMHPEIVGTEQRARCPSEAARRPTSTVDRRGRVLLRLRRVPFHDRAPSSCSTVDTAPGSRSIFPTLVRPAPARRERADVRFSRWTRRSSRSLFDVRDRVAIVTGGTRGIGRAVAEGFVCGGAKVVVGSRKAEACARDRGAPARLGGGDAVGVPAHMGELDAATALVDRRRRPRSAASTSS